FICVYYRPVVYADGRLHAQLPGCICRRVSTCVDAQLHTQMHVCMCRCLSSSDDSSALADACLLDFRTADASVPFFATASLQLSL
ncbi:hypothetical protein KI387_001049, partial [Taxus chinensis]